MYDYFDFYGLWIEQLTILQKERLSQWIENDDFFLIDFLYDLDGISFDFGNYYNCSLEFELNDKCYRNSQCHGIVLPLPTQPQLMNTAYSTVDDIVRDLKAAYGQYLPKDFDYKANICHAQASMWEFGPDNDFKKNNEPIKQEWPMFVIDGYLSISSKIGLMIEYPEKILKDILDLTEEDLSKSTRLSPLYEVSDSSKEKIYQYFLVDNMGLPLSNDSIYWIKLSDKDDHLLKKVSLYWIKKKHGLFMQTPWYP